VLPRKEPRHRFSKRLGGPQSRSRCLEARKISRTWQCSNRGLSGPEPIHCTPISYDIKNCHVFFLSVQALLPTDGEERSALLYAGYVVIYWSPVTEAGTVQRLSDFRRNALLCLKVGSDFFRLVNLPHCTKRLPEKVQCFQFCYRHHLIVLTYASLLLHIRLTVMLLVDGRELRAVPLLFPALA
jgi:hypothetical protein